MSILKMVRRFTPPGLLSTFQRCNPSPPAAVWSGVYSRFEEVPVRGLGYDGSTWLDLVRQTTRELLEQSKPGRWPAAPQHPEYALLSLLVATHKSRNGTPLRVLDIGGGMGVSYLHAKAAAIGCSVDYHIVERPEICHEGPTVLGRPADLRFHSSLDDELPQFDIVYMSGVLQYFADFRSVLKRVMGLGPSQILIAKVNAGKFPTYATAQTNVSGSVIACWFFNLDELVHELETGGYSLVFKVTDVRRYQHEGVPEERRMFPACHLLFEKVKVGQNPSSGHHEQP